MESDDEGTKSLDGGLQRTWVTDADTDKTCFENLEAVDLVCLPPIDQPDVVLPLRIVMSLLEGPAAEVLVLDIPRLDGLVEK